jgi:DNA-binding NtrC family response regulator
MAPTILLIDGDSHASQLQSHLRKAVDGSHVLMSATLAGALKLIRRDNVACVVTELVLPDARHELVLQALRRLSPRVPIVVATSHGSEELARMALKAGAADYIPKRDGLLVEVSAAVREALGRSAITASPVTGEGFGSDAPAELVDGEIVCASAETRSLLAASDRAARSSVPVLIEGETGTGKELVARLIHRRSARRTAAFIAQNCAALPDALLETELFGHLRGAFTGADRDRRGLLVEAGDGSIFLDEIGEAPLGVQAKLLRVLQHGEVKAVGADRAVRIRARFVAATNRRLEDEVAAGRFREDLYYRLTVFPIGISPLRHRVGEIPRLAEHFLARYQAQERRELDGLAPNAVETLQAYPWPGNVRELEHEMHRLILALPQGRRIHRHHLAPRIQAADGIPLGKPLRSIVRDVELAVIRQRLREHPTKASAARSLGLTREALYDKLRRLQAVTQRETVHAATGAQIARDLP